MIVSVDGRATVAGRVAALTGPADQGVLMKLRSLADAVLVGAATVRAEGYGSLLGDESRAERVEDGRPAEPLLCVVSRSARLPDGVATPNEVVAPGADGDFAAAFDHLESEHGVTRIVCEGGPTLLGMLLRHRLVDEAFVTISPTVAFDPAALTLLAGTGAGPRAAELLSCQASGGYVFLRYALGDR